jgi:hypothetical protein
MCVRCIADRIAVPCYPNVPFSFVFTESIQRLQNVALGTKTNCPNDGVEQETPNEAKKNSQNVKHFSLKDFAGFLPISKIRGRFSLDSSPTSSDGK